MAYTVTYQRRTKSGKTITVRRRVAGSKKSASSRSKRSRRTSAEQTRRKRHSRQFAVGGRKKGRKKKAPKPKSIRRELGVINSYIKSGQAMMMSDRNFSAAIERALKQGMSVQSSGKDKAIIKLKDGRAFTIGRTVSR